MIFRQMISYGGPVMLVLAFCSILAVYIFALKCFQFYRAQVNVDELITGLKNVLRRDGMIEAITLCDHTPGPVARLLGAAIRAYQNDDEIKEALESQSLIEVPRLESKLNILATIAYAAPLLGLLGTVLGMVDTFDTLQAKSTSVTLIDLSGGFYKALVCTAAGIAIAIPCHIAYNFLISWIKDSCVEMERASMEIIYFLKHHERTDQAK